MNNLDTRCLTEGGDVGGDMSPVTVVVADVAYVTDDVEVGKWISGARGKETTYM